MQEKTDYSFPRMATAAQPDATEVNRGQKPKQEALLEAGTDA